ncbi:MAG: CDP-glucose 4,6-dehydratase [Helicobacteraceae bacterium]|jgi:CDP-glucose 4,6-dehydratase|nr:CDP-glucose 4,6-dehydratase [Helicobacteraceae bacterium]
MRFLITGHTGFVGAWLTLYLRELGQEVCGLALPPYVGANGERGLYDLARTGEALRSDLRVDIRDFEALKEAIEAQKPDFVVHLAAQQLVRESFRAPRLTFETNVMGTVNVLEAIKDADVKGAIVAATDKVYKNVSQIWGYREDDPLGASDPLSGSKAAADLIAQSYIARGDYKIPIGIVRSANLLGGGDNCKEHLVVDLINACKNGAAAKLRNPKAIRSWQHVLDSINGYYMLALRLIDGSLPDGAKDGAFNFGASAESSDSVGSVATMIVDRWGEGAKMWEFEGDAENIKEEETLGIDSKKAKFYLGWDNKLDLERVIDWTIGWEKEVFNGADARSVSQRQVKEFLSL